MILDPPLRTWNVQIVRNADVSYFWLDVTLGAFPLRGSARLSSGRFAFPLQFSNALEWVGLFTCCYSCAASTAVTSL